MEGLEVLRMCKMDGDKYIRNTIICCSADIKCCCGKVDSLAKCIVPYEHGHLNDANGGGEYIQWDARHMMAAMIKAYQLHEVAKERPVEVHVAIDGAQLSKNWNHLTAGAKQGDNTALCPRKKHLIYGNADTTTIQSRDHCFPYIMAMCRETKKSIEWMRPQLEHLEAMGKEGVKWWGDYKHLQIVHNSDLSLMWKYRERGGAAKVKKYFCHCCTLKSDDIVKANEQKCLKWCDPDLNCPCYHQTFANNTNLQEYRQLHQQLGNVLAQWMQPLAEIQQHTCLNVNEDPRQPTPDSKKSIDSIHYEIWHDDVSNEQKQQYARKVTYDLILRGMPVPELLADQQQSLQQALVMEHQYWDLGEAIAACDKERANIIALIKNVPCILHLENHTGLKIFTTVVQKGLSRAKSGELFPETKDAGCCFDMFFAKLNHIVCTEILGSANNPSQWECPCD